MRPRVRVKELPDNIQAIERPKVAQAKMACVLALLVLGSIVAYYCEYATSAQRALIDQYGTWSGIGIVAIVVFFAVRAVLS